MQHEQARVKKEGDLPLYNFFWPGGATQPGPPPVQQKARAAGFDRFSTVDPGRDPLDEHACLLTASPYVTGRHRSGGRTRMQRREETLQSCVWIWQGKSRMRTEGPGGEEALSASAAIHLSLDVMQVEMSHLKPCIGQSSAFLLRLAPVLLLTSPDQWAIPPQHAGSHS